MGFFFSKMVEYDPMDVKWYKLGDIEWPGEIVKFIMVISKFGMT